MGLSSLTAEDIEKTLVATEVLLEDIKAIIGSSFTQGSVLFSDGFTITEDNANFFWDDTNDRLGIGTNTPGVKLHALKGGTAVGDGTEVAIFQNNNLTTDNAIISLVAGNAGVSRFQFSDVNDRDEGFIEFDHSTGKFNIGDNGSEVNLTIDSSGNIGIGTTSPAAKFEVMVDDGDNVSGILIDQNDTGEVGLTIDSQATTAANLLITSPTITTGNVLDISSANSLTTGTALRVDSASTAFSTGMLISSEYITSGDSLTNRTGIINEFASSRTESRTSGTTADDFDMMRLTRTSVTTGAGGTLTAAGAVLRLRNSITETAGTLTDTVTVLEVFQSGNSTGPTATFSGGFVGIGTVSPEVLLHLQTTTESETNLLILERDSNLPDTEVGILFKDRSAISTGQEASRIWTDRQSTTGNFDLVFQAGDQDSAGLQTESIRIQGDTGFVGMGTTNPDNKLHVEGTGLTKIQIESDTEDATIQFKENSGGDVFEMGIDRSASGNFRMSSSSGLSTDNILTIESTGDFGITTTNPTARLHISVADGDNKTAVFVDQNDTGARGIDIDSESTTHSALYFNSPVTTVGNMIDVAGANSLTTGSVLNIDSNSPTTSSGDLLDITHVVAADSLTNKTLYFNRFQSNRTEARTTGTTADNYDLMLLERTSVTTGAGGTLTAAGSVLKIENITTETDGTLTDTVIPLEVIQDTDSTGAVATFTGGNVGIGVSVPDVDLHVATAGTTALKIEAGDTEEARILMQTGSAIDWRIFSDGGDGKKLKIHEDVNDNGVVFTIDTAGNVGIGTTSPVARLEIMVDDGDNVPGLLIDQDDVGEIALEIDSQATTVDVFKITAPSTTTGNVINIAGANTLTTGAGIEISANSPSITSGQVSIFSHSRSEDGLADKTGSMNIFQSLRTETRTSGTTTDDFDVLRILRSSTMNGIGGTLASTGSVLRLVNAAIETAGTLTDSARVLEIVQDADSTGDAIFIDQNSTTGRAIEIDQDSNSASDIYAIRIVNDNAGSGNPGGIDLSGFSVDEPLVKTIADAITTAGTVSHQIAIDIGGTTFYLVAHTHGS